MQYDLVINHGKVVTARGIEDVSLYIKDEKIVKIGTEDGEVTSDKEIDAKGHYVFPGFIDPHVHLNDPGLTQSEDFYTGTCGAAAGGVTTVLDHPLTLPLPDNVKDFMDKKIIGLGKSIINFGLYGACTAENESEMEKMIENGAVAFKTFMTYSEEIPKLNDGELLDRMTYLSNKNIVLTVHCENNDIVEHYTKVAKNDGRTELKDYPDSRPELAEVEAVSRVSLFARKTGCKINIAHCTLKDAVDVVKVNNSLGADITVETCVQYLTMDKAMIDDLGVYAICNPPLRSKNEVEGLWLSVFNGDIDWICSDHAPYTPKEKELIDGNVFNVPAGTTGIETNYQVFFSEGVMKRGLPLETFVQMTSTNAAKRYGLFPQKGILREGADADITIIDPNMTWTIDENKLKHKMKWSIFNGMELKGKVVKTIVNGRETYDGEKILVDKGSGRYITKQRGQSDIL